MRSELRFSAAARLSKALLFAALVCAAAGAAREAAAFAVYTSRDAWEAAVGDAFTTDPFDNPVANAASITFDTGVVSVHQDFDSFGTFEDANAIFAVGRYQGRASRDVQEITWTFPSAIRAFGADWISPVSLGLLTVRGNFDETGTATVEFLDHIARDTDGFLGIVGASPFVSIVFGTELTPQNEAFAADNLSFTSQVPEPATIVLLAVGLAALGLRRRPRAA